MSLLPHLGNSATFTQLITLGNANTNGASLDLQGYKGPVTFVLSVGQSTHGIGNVDVANIQTFTADTAASYADVSGGNFTAVINSANASNVSLQTKTFDVRALSRWVRCPLVISGTNANIPVSLTVIGQKERV
jgi:hypothetical protein